MQLTLSVWSLAALLCVAYAVGVAHRNKDSYDSETFAIVGTVVAVLVFTVRITLYFNS